MTVWHRKYHCSGMNWINYKVESLCYVCFIVAVRIHIYFDFNWTIKKHTYHLNADDYLRSDTWMTHMFLYCKWFIEISTCELQGRYHRKVPPRFWVYPCSKSHNLVRLCEVTIMGLPGFPSVVAALMKCGTFSTSCCNVQL